MTITEIQSRNYKATVRRGLITPSTSKREFIAKLCEEVIELEESIDNEPEELADVIMVCLAMAEHFKIDILQAMSKKVIYNEGRLP